MKLRIVVAIVNAVVITYMWLSGFIDENLGGEFIDWDTGELNLVFCEVLSISIFLCAAPISFCLFCISEGLLFALGKLQKKNYDIWFLKLSTFFVAKISIEIFWGYSVIQIVLVNVFVCIFSMFFYKVENVAKYLDGLAKRK